MKIKSVYQAFIYSSEDDSNEAKVEMTHEHHFTYETKDTSKLGRLALSIPGSCDCRPAHPFPELRVCPAQNAPSLSAPELGEQSQ